MLICDADIIAYLDYYSIWSIYLCFVLESKKYTYVWLFVVDKFTAFHRVFTIEFNYPCAETSSGANMKRIYENTGVIGKS